MSCSSASAGVGEDDICASDGYLRCNADQEYPDSSHLCRYLFLITGPCTTGKFQACMYPDDVDDRHAEPSSSKSAGVRRVSQLSQRQVKTPLIKVIRNLSCAPLRNTDHHPLNDWISRSRA